MGMTPCNNLNFFILLMALSTWILRDAFLTPTINGYFFHNHPRLTNPDYTDFFAYNTLIVFSNLRLARFASLVNSVCCRSILQSSRHRILALFHFFSLEMFRFAFVGSSPPSMCLEHIRVCLVTLRLSSRHAAIHLPRLSWSLIPGAYCFFSFSFVENSKK